MEKVLLGSVMKSDCPMIIINAINADVMKK